MILKRLFILFATCYPLLSYSAAPSILIIGGGPTGLATAIEAQAAGADVTIIEKRSCYTREQYLFLSEASLQLLSNWGISIPEMVVGVEGGEKVGVMLLKHLEIALARTVEELGIPKIYGEFQEIKEGKAVIVENDRTNEYRYDILIGADGTHSVVRDCLQIPLKVEAADWGALAVIPHGRGEVNLEFLYAFKFKDHFLTKIIVHNETLVSVQAKENFTKETMVSLVSELGWSKEAAGLSENNERYMKDIGIYLQQAENFSDRNNYVLILGDAAATGSFLTGIGANYCFETTMIASKFFKSDRQERDFDQFEQEMHEASVRFIQENRPLFE